MLAHRAPPESVSLLTGIDELERVGGEWNALAERRRSPFLTVDWLVSWWAAYGDGSPAIYVIHDEHGRLAGGAAFGRTGRWLGSASNEQSGEWGALAGDEPTRDDVWRALAGAAPRRLRLDELLPDEVEVARRQLTARGFHLLRRPGMRSPYLALPGSRDALLAGASRNLRSQFQRRRRALEREGRLELRTVRAGADAEVAFERFLHLEAAGWKGRERTALLTDPRLLSLHRAFARRAAAHGWLRLYLLELDGRLLAADYGCAFGGRGFLIKTAYDERYGGLSPGLVLRGEVLGACVDEGLRGYDFLGGSEQYKLRWASEVRPREGIVGYRGGPTVPERVYWSRMRPRLKRVRDRARRATSS
jgi:CelD/BcsL family acetyltransferase involved in cellulose biosynthesis